MKTILLINLRRLGDIYSMAHIIASLKSKSNTKISLLVYKECYAAAKNLTNIDHVYTIDRKQITTLYNNPIFEPSFAINRFFDSIAPIRNQDWDIVANISNDLVSSHLLSMLTNFNNKTDHIGVKFSNTNSPSPSNDWAQVYNDILTSYTNCPINFIDCQHRMLEIDPVKITDPLKINSPFQKLAEDQIHNIRIKENHQNRNILIVGIQLKSSNKSKDIPFTPLIDLIDLILDNPAFYPVLLVAPIQDELNYAKQLNSYFDDRLIVIESDLSALTSVLKNLDILITPDTVTKHIADLVELDLVEIALGEAPYLKQGTTRKDNLILTSTDPNNISGDDIYSALKVRSNPEKLRYTKFNEQISLYKCTKDSVGTSYQKIYGDLSSNDDFARLFARKYLLERLDNIPFSLTDIQHPPIPIMTNWIQSEKNSLTEYSRNLLQTIREFIQVKECLSNQRNSFIKSLDKLLAGCDKNKLASIPLLFFRGALESLPRLSFESSSTQLEPLLFNLKNDFQILLNHLNDLEHTMAQRKPIHRKQQAECTP